MKLYHGTNVSFETIDLVRSMPYKDFGRGFYLTDNLQHAQSMAERRVARFGGEQMILKYEFDLDLAAKDLSIKRFTNADEDWARFVMKNRDRHSAQPTHNYDIVIGPIADDDIAVSFRLFDAGFININELIERLKYKELSIQYFFHNNKALSYLNLL